MDLCGGREVTRVPTAKVTGSEATDVIDQHERPVLSVLAYNLTRVMNIVGIKPLIAAIAA